MVDEIGWDRLDGMGWIGLGLAKDHRRSSEVRSGDMR